MTRLRHMLPFIVMFLVAGLAVAACAEEDVPDTAADEQEEEPDSDQEDVPEDEEAIYPSDTITLVVPWAAGGGTDLVGRALADAMTEFVDEEVVVENVEGAGSAIGSAEVQNSEPDGHTLLLNTASTITQTYMGRHEGTETVNYEELIPVANVNVDPYTMQVGPDAPWESLSELIDHARENPGEVQMGVAGVGSQSQLMIPMLEDLTGAEFQQVSFDGSGPANVALMGGHIDAHGPAIGDFAHYIEDDAITLLAVAADERHSAFPDVPTFQEEGVDLSYGLFRGVWAPQGTPPEVVAQIEELVLAAADTAKFRDALDDLNYGHAMWTHEEFQETVDTQAVLLEQAMEDAGMFEDM